MQVPTRVALVVVSFVAAWDVAEAQSNRFPVTGGLVAGGVGGIMTADSTVRAVANDVKSAVTRKLSAQNVAMTQFTVINYKTQVVAGTNYFIKIKVNSSRSNGYIFVKVFQNLQGRNSLTSVQTGLGSSDTVGFF